jgi:hypothetical protein
MQHSSGRSCGSLFELQPVLNHPGSWFIQNLVAVQLASTDAAIWQVLQHSHLLCDRNTLGLLLLPKHGPDGPLSGACHAVACHPAVYLC